MVRGIVTNLLYPFGYFSSRGMTGTQMYATALEAIRVLTSIGFKVQALVADGASPNRADDLMTLWQMESLDFCTAYKKNTAIYTK